MSSHNKLTSDRNQKALLELCAQPGNDICADCKSRNPRWTSWNLGIFLCVTCASMHRKLGTHISKVKSVTMDTWTNDQLESMKNMGNRKSNAIFNPNETRHPPPADLDASSRDSELEKYIRAKYEYKKYCDRTAFVASKLGPSRSASSLTPRSASNPTIALRSSTLPSNSGSSTSPPPVTPARSQLSQPSTSTSRAVPQRSVSQPLSAAQINRPPSAQPVQQPQQKAGGVWDDLVQLQSSPTPALPLQYQSTPTSFMQQPLSLSLNPTGFGYQTQQQFTPTFQQQQSFTPTFQPQQQSYGYTPTNTPSSSMFLSQPQNATLQLPSASLFQPQPHSAGLPNQQQPGYLTPSPSISMHSAAPTQSGFTTPTPMLSSNGSQFDMGMGMPATNGMGGGAFGIGGMRMTMTPSPAPLMGMGRGSMGGSHSPAPMMMQSQFGGMGQQQQMGMGVNMSMGGGNMGMGMMQQPQQQMQMGQMQQGMGAGNMMSSAQFSAGMMNGGVYGGNQFGGQPQQQQQQWGGF